MPSETVPAKKARSKRRRTLGLVGAALIAAVTAAGYATYRHYTDSARIRAVAEAYLQPYVNGTVTIGSAHFSWLDGVRLSDVVVTRGDRAATVDAKDTASKVFSCRHVILKPDPLSLLWGGLRIESVVALEPTCWLVRDEGAARTSLSGLFRLPSDSVIVRDAASLPTVELRDARIRVISRESGVDRLVDDLTLTIRARPSKHDRAVFDIVWQSGSERASSGHSQIDLRTGHVRNVQGGLPWMSIEAVAIAIHAGSGSASAWGDLLGLSGTVRVSDYDLVGGKDGAGHRSATIELRDASISIPVSDEEHGLAPGDRYLRFDHVNGFARLTDDAIRAEFSGVFHGARCSVSTTIRSADDRPRSLADVAFDVELSVTDLVLPRTGPSGGAEEIPRSEAGFVERWPGLAGFYRDFAPRGAIDLEITATKAAGADALVRVKRARLSLKGGDMVCRYMPYPLPGLTGTIEYSPEEVVIRGVRSVHEGTTVMIDGRVTPPSADGRKDLRIVGTGVTLDDTLWSALSPRFRKLREEFLPTGTVDVEITLSQPPAALRTSTHWETQTRIALRGVSASYRAFPYRVDGLTGELAFGSDEVKLIRLAGRSGDADVLVEGILKLEGGKVADVDLGVRGTNVAIDDKLLAALSGDVRARINSLRLRGRFDVATSLSLDPATGRVVHTSDVILRDAEVFPVDFPFSVEGIMGRLHITRDEVLLEGVTGRHADATVSVEGTIGVTARGPGMSLLVRSRNLRVDKSLRTALPGGMRDDLANWSVDGPIATETILRTAPDTDRQTASIQTVVRMSGAAVSHPSFPQPFEDVHAELTFDDDGFRAEGVEAKYGGATVRLDLASRSSDHGKEVTVSLSAIDVSLDESLRGLLPARLLGVWDHARPSGTIDLHVDELRRRPSKTGGPPEWTVKGHVELRDVSLPGVAGIGGVTGKLSGSGTTVDSSGGTTLEGQLSLATLHVWGRRLDDAEAAWSYVQVAGGDGMMTLKAIRGRIYDGSVSGSLELAFDSAGTDYSLSTTVHHVAIEPLVNATCAATTPAKEPIEVSGLLDGTLYLSGKVGDVGSRRGGGRFKISDGHIYRVPLVLAILNVLNLSIPEEDAIDEARGDLYVVGSRVNLEDLRLQGKSLALVGSGSVSLPDGGLDLGLVSVNPHRWARVPVLADFMEGASREIVELHVTGPLSSPSVKIRPFRGITEELKRLFKKRKPKPIPPTEP